ncbi:MAG: sigma-70 family RNA polymerase sigma factor [Planctomycetes bacterium]|nr:sigma-70 family RNA polymerase sigma factor [Planctomycetota bacterium]
MPESPQPGKQSRREESHTAEFVRLLALHERRLAACVLTLVLDWDRANDILQETKLRLWEQFDDYDPSKDFGAWSRTIARYMVLKHREQAARDHLLIGPEYLEAMAEEVAAVSDGLAERQSALARCVDELAEGPRDLLRRCYLPGSSLKKVAQQLNRTPGSLYKAVERIRRRLLQCVEDKLSKGASR